MSCFDSRVKVEIYFAKASPSSMAESITTVSLLMQKRFQRKETVSGDEIREPVMTSKIITGIVYSM